MSAIATVVSARTASRRLPGKARLDLGGVSVVQCLLDRLRTTRLGGRVVFATTERPDDDVLAAHVAKIGITVFRGSDADVAGRHVALARRFGLDWLIRVTADCPFVDAQSLDHCISQWDPRDEIDLVSTKGVFPVGIDYELVSAATLEREWPKMNEQEREHLTLRFYRPELGFAVKQFVAPADWPASANAYVVDTPADYEKARRRVDALGNRTFSVRELLSLGSAS